MAFLKKTVLLTNKNKGITYGMAVLNIQKGSNGVFGNLKTFDFKDDNLLLGISVNGKQVVKQSVLLGGNGTFNFKLNNNFDINGSIAGVLVRVEMDSVVPLAWGCNDKRAIYKDAIVDALNSDIRPKSVQRSVEVETKPITPQQVKAELFEDTEPDELEQFIDHQIDETTPPQTDDFYHLIKGQLDDLFETYPMHEQLMGIVPDSKWVRVDYENNGKEYVVGLIYDGDTIKYICYGVPGMYSKMPPENLQAYSQWLPVDLSDPEGEGYWVMYQDAVSGDSVEVSA